MVHMIIVFPKKEVGVNIRNILNRNGLDAAGVCTTGAQALQCADTMDEGIVICGYRMKDMMYSELRECLPDTFEMLLISSTEKWSDGLEPGVLGLPMPLKVYDLSLIHIWVCPCPSRSMICSTVWKCCGRGSSAGERSGGRRRRTGVQSRRP